jgi:hypothetical protein
MITGERAIGEVRPGSLREGLIQVIGADVMTGKALVKSMT